MFPTVRPVSPVSGCYTFTLLHGLVGFITIPWVFLWLNAIPHLLSSAQHLKMMNWLILSSGIVFGAIRVSRIRKQLESPVRRYGRLILAFSLITVFNLAVLSVVHSQAIPQIFNWVPEDLVFGIISFMLIFPGSFCIGGLWPCAAAYYASWGKKCGPVSMHLYTFHLMMGALGLVSLVFLWLPSMGMRGAWVIMALIAFVSSQSFRFLITLKQGGLLHRNSTRPPVSFRLFSFSMGGFLSASATAWMAILFPFHLGQFQTMTLLFVWIIMFLALGGFVAHRWVIREHTFSLLIILSSTSVALSPLWMNWIKAYLAPYLSDAYNATQLGLTLLCGGVCLIVPVAPLGISFPLLIERTLSWGDERTAIRWVGSTVALFCAGIFSGILVGNELGIPMLGPGLFIAGLVITYVLLGVVWAMKQDFFRDRRLHFHMIYLMAFAIPIIFAFFPKPFLPTESSTVGKAFKQLRRLQLPVGSMSVATKGPHMAFLENGELVYEADPSPTNAGFRGYLTFHLMDQPKSIFVSGMDAWLHIAEPFSLLNAPLNLTICEPFANKMALGWAYFSREFKRSFEHGRVDVRAADPYTNLLTQGHTYDIIIGGEFGPWKRNGSKLLSVDFFQAAKSRIKTGGFFIQFLPLSKLDDNMLSMVIATMQSVFPRVSLWRDIFRVQEPVVALVGHRDGAPVAPDLIKNTPMLLMYYCFDTDRLNNYFPDVGVNTLDNRRLEYLTQRSQRLMAGSIHHSIKNDAFIRLQELSLILAPLKTDDWLRHIPMMEKSKVLAGFYMNKAIYLKQSGQLRAAEKFMEEAENLIF